jgi:hypothetical protein
MAKAIGPEVVTVDFKSQDVCKTILEAVPGGLDGMYTSSPVWTGILIDSLYRRYYLPRAQDYAP